MNIFTRFIHRLSYLQKCAGIVILGSLVGCGLLFLYILRAHSYLGDDPSACVNCHIMSAYYASWNHSSHSRNATCNDCHVPHENVVRKYAFKGMDGMKHVGMWVARAEEQAPRAGEESCQVIMNNCIRCHTSLNTTMVKSGQVDYMMTEVGQGKACWDCHRQVPHGGHSSLTESPLTKVPLPASPVPEWLQKAVRKK